MIEMIEMTGLIEMTGMTNTETEMKETEIKEAKE